MEQPVLSALTTCVNRAAGKKRRMLFGNIRETVEEMGFWALRMLIKEPFELSVCLCTGSGFDQKRVFQVGGSAGKCEGHL